MGEIAVIKKHHFCIDEPHLNWARANFKSRYLCDESMKSLQKKMRIRPKHREQTVQTALYDFHGVSRNLISKSPD